MDTKDLEKFLVLAETENMQLAANMCNSSPSVMSKSLKRVEHQLGVQLFDRVGKYIKTNNVGIKFRQSAVKIVAQTHQTMAECMALQVPEHYRVAAPSILYFRCANVVL